MNNSIWPIDQTQTSQSGPESKGHERVLHILQTPRLKPHHQLQFDVICRTKTSLWGQQMNAQSFRNVWSEQKSSAQVGQRSPDKDFIFLVTLVQGGSCESGSFLLQKPGLHIFKGSGQQGLGWSLIWSPSPAYHLL